MASSTAQKKFVQPLRDNTKLGILPPYFNDLSAVQQAQWMLHAIETADNRTLHALHYAQIPQEWLSVKFLKSVIQQGEEKPTKPAPKAAEPAAKATAAQSSTQSSATKQATAQSSSQASSASSKSSTSASSASTSSKSSTSASSASTSQKPSKPQAPTLYPLFPLASQPNDFIDLTTISNYDYLHAMNRMMTRISQYPVDFVMDLPVLTEMPRLLAVPSDYSLFLNFNPPTHALKAILATLPSRYAEYDANELLRVLIKIWNWAVENMTSPLILRQLLPTSLRQWFTVESKRYDGYQLLAAMARSLKLDTGKDVAKYASEKLARWNAEAGLAGSMGEAFVFTDYRWFNSRSVSKDMVDLDLKEKSLRQNITAVLHAFGPGVPSQLLEAARLVVDELMMNLPIETSPVMLAKDIFDHFQKLQELDAKKNTNNKNEGGNNKKGQQGRNGGR